MSTDVQSKIKLEIAEIYIFEIKLEILEIYIFGIDRSGAKF